MNDFEKALAKQPMRSIPPEWRSQILPPAEAGVAAAAETAAPWWRLLLWPSPVAWAGVGCAWVVIIGLNVAVRFPTIGEGNLLSISSDDIGRALVERRVLMGQLFHVASDAPAPPRKRETPGASVIRNAAAKTA